MEVDELYWDIVFYVASAIKDCIEGYFFYRFVKPFLPENRYTYITGVIFSVAMLLMNPIPVSGSIESVIIAAVIFVTMYLLDRRNVEQKIFLAVTCYLMDWISWGILIAVWNAVYYFEMLIPAMQKSVLLQFVMYLVNEIVWLVVEVVAMKFIIRLLHRAYTYKSENMSKKELAFMLAPFLSIAAGRWVFRYFTNVYEMDLKQYVWDNHHGYNLMLFLYQMISFAAMFTIIVIYQSIKDSQRKEKEETVLARQMEDMEKHISEVEKLYYDIRSLKHDMKNHVMILENLCRGDAEAGKYAAQLNEQIDEAALPIEVKSGNPITDIIIGEKQKEAEGKGIAFQYEFHYPEDTELNAFDVSVILNNAVNNAIEAAIECEKPYIKLSSYRKNNTYMIEIRNSVMGKRLLDTDSGLPITTKQGEGHGFGLANIRKMSQKYQGEIEIEQGGGEFVLNVMLMLG